MIASSLSVEMSRAPRCLTRRRASTSQILSCPRACGALPPKTPRVRRRGLARASVADGSAANLWDESVAHADRDPHGGTRATCSCKRAAIRSRSRCRRAGRDAAVHGVMASLVRAENGRPVGFGARAAEHRFRRHGRSRAMVHRRVSQTRMPRARSCSAISSSSPQLYNSVSAGASIEAFDDATGAPRWVGSVQTSSSRTAPSSNDVEIHL